MSQCVQQSPRFYHEFDAISPKLNFSQNQTRPTPRVRTLKLRYSHVSEFQSMFSLAFRTRRYSIEYEYHFIE